ncbi:MAG: helix-turn-helix domain-containing protein [Cyanobacteriota bacterium]|nr:helix-turn-helix domain-containing protein [Cyanobacteriota bacterium]
MLPPDNPSNVETPPAGKYLTPFQRKHLHKSLQDPNLSEKYRQRLQIVLLADESKTQTQICQILNCAPATVRHWLWVARTGQAHLWQATPIGRPKRVTEEYKTRLRELAICSPKEIEVPHQSYKYHHARWTAKRLSRHLAQELGIELSDRHINRLLKEMGLSTRGQPPAQSEPQNTQNGIVIDNLNSPPDTEIPPFWHFNPGEF